MEEKIYHIPVLPEAVLTGLDIKPTGTYIDGTCGGGGHSAEIAKRLEGGVLLGIDRDPDAVEEASGRLAQYGVKVVRGNYSDMAEIARRENITAADGILLDLGVSSHQLDAQERGFSYHGDAPLDMRMSKEGQTAADLVNSLSAEELSRIMYEYGEEKFSRRIAEEIVKRRAVNNEFGHLDKGLDEAFGLLKSGGRLCVITFHSLEDRIVKRKFAEFCKGCTCPPDFPVCVCGNTPRGKLVNRRPTEATEEEVERNIRSRSAKLRVIEKI